MPRVPKVGTLVERPSVNSSPFVVIYDETKDYDSTKLWSSPNPTVVGGNINPQNLPQAMVDNKCIDLYPHQRLRVNTIFEVAQKHGQTAYTDKHPSYDLVRGPSGKGLDVGYFPEIQSVDSKSALQTSTLSLYPSKKRIIG